MYNNLLNDLALIDLTASGDTAFTATDYVNFVAYAAAQMAGAGDDQVVLLGDFNTWSAEETAIKLMREAFPDSPAWDGLPTRGSFPADHMFFRRRSFVNFDIDGYRRVENAYGSDHLGRRLTLRYGASPQPR